MSKLLNYSLFSILLCDYVTLTVEGDSHASKAKKPGKPKAAEAFSHPLLLASLKGHAGEVTGFDISSSGKYLISTATGQEIIFENFVVFLLQHIL